MADNSEEAAVDENGFDERLWHERFVSVDTWWNATRGNGKMGPLPLLDVRPIEEFLSERIVGLPANGAGVETAGGPHVDVVHIPISSLRERSFELPPRHVKFALLLPAFSDPIGSEGSGHGDQILTTELEDLITFLLGDQVRGQEEAQPQHQYSSAAASDAAHKQKKRRKTKKQPWKIQQILVATDEFWKRARELGIHSEKNVARSPLVTEQKLSRLWEPDPMVQNVLLPEIVTQRQSVSQHCLIFDFGSGSGRDVSFLAESLVFTALHLASQVGSDANGGSRTTNVTVVGADHRYRKQEETQKVCDFWERRGVGAPVTKALTLDVSSWDIVKPHLSAAIENTHVDTFTSTSTFPKGKEIDCPIVLAIYMVRFLNRELLQSIAKERACLPSGTLFGISHFAKPYEDAPWPFDHPSPATVLERNELRNLFSSPSASTSVDGNYRDECDVLTTPEEDDGWIIVCDDIVKDTDHGRTMIHFVAKKR